MTLKKDRIAAVPHGGEEQWEAADLDQASFKWEALVPVEIHAVKVAIVEAMVWTHMPVSARQVQRMFDEPEAPSVSVISFHMRRLAGYGAVAKTGSRAVRGAKETFYFLPPELIVKGSGAR